MPVITLEKSTGMGRKVDTSRDAEIKALRIQGKRAKAIAVELDMTYARVSNRLKVIDADLEAEGYTFENKRKGKDA